MMPGVCLNFIANIWYFLCILGSSLKFCVFLCEHKDGKKNKYTPEVLAGISLYSQRYTDFEKRYIKVPIICNKIVPF